MNLQELEERAQSEYEATKRRLRERYALARKLGFNAKEAKILSNKSEKTIKHLTTLKEERAR